MPWIRWAIKEHDGIEVPVLYILMYLNLGLALCASMVPSKFLKWGWLLLLPMSCALFMTIGFHPPMSAPATDLTGLCVIGIVLLITILLSLVNAQSRWVGAVIILILFVVCMTASSWISRQDYVFIFSPAQRLLRGFGLNDSYFQYDYFISILAALWMKLHLSIWSFPVLGRLSFWVLLSGIYLFSRKYFTYKRLSIYLIINLTLIKIYANTYMPDFAFQNTPLRLDLWLLVLVAAYWKGADHWLLGAVLSILIFFSRTFGCIYSASYFAFLLFLVATEISGSNSWPSVLRRLASLHLKNIILITCSFLVCKFLSGPHASAAAQYLKGGYGFLPISRQSFYWYMPVLFSLVFLLLLKNRTLLSRRFFETSVLLICLAIGNSVYFFGRSHENNIINIAASLVLVLFLLLDLLYVEVTRGSLAPRLRLIFPIAATVLITLTSYSYAQRVPVVAFIQWFNIRGHHLFHPYDRAFDPVPLKAATHSSPKVIFLSEIDFFYAYETGYELPDNYNCFLRSWFMLKDYADFLNDELAKGYYVVVPQNEASFNWEIINQLKAGHFVLSNDFVVLSH